MRSVWVRRRGTRGRNPDSYDPLTGFIEGSLTVAAEALAAVSSRACRQCPSEAAVRRVERIREDRREARPHDRRVFRLGPAGELEEAPLSADQRRRLLFKPGVIEVEHHVARSGADLERKPGEAAAVVTIDGVGRLDRRHVCPGLEDQRHAAQPDARVGPRGIEDVQPDPSVVWPVGAGRTEHPAGAHVTREKRLADDRLDSHHGLARRDRRRGEGRAQGTSSLRHVLVAEFGFHSAIPVGLHARLLEGVIGLLEPVHPGVFESGDGFVGVKVPAESGAAVRPGIGNAAGVLAGRVALGGRPVAGDERPERVIHRDGGPRTNGARPASPGQRDGGRAPRHPDPSPREALRRTAPKGAPGTSEAHPTQAGAGSDPHPAPPPGGLAGVPEDVENFRPSRIRVPIVCVQTNGAGYIQGRRLPCRIAST